LHHRYKNGSRNYKYFLPLAGVALGGIVGELIDIDLWVNNLEDYLERKFTGIGSKTKAVSSAPDGGLSSQGQFAK
jgi:uncharacterized membrane protein YqgA involved in biofilm formation